MALGTFVLDSDDVWVNYPSKFIIFKLVINEKDTH